ncbi:GGDEF and EAL domain-containing protein [Amycolatopsis aidingensis]|uniref:GGDEF and EAL domain-containing protein n=1 Tax=Amycolatopsis aidingensis TaxID=2842453 RepID=UPI001C0E7873|nr:GGDEF and EAL domain-containing protein [Amycolatopsis aidingensis]
MERWSVPKPGDAPGLVEIARRWATTLADTKGVTLPTNELQDVLLDMAREVHAQSDTARDAAVHRFTALYSASPIGIALAGPDGLIVEANQALVRILGGEVADLRGRAIAELGATERDAGSLAAGIAELSEHDLPRYRERLKLTHATDGPLWVHVTLARLPGDGSGTTYPVLMVEDANELHLLQETLRYQNLHDPLTGLPNSSQFLAKLEASLSESPAAEIGLVYLDLDGFKVINDGLGAGVGDHVLRGVAGKLCSVFTSHDAFVARLSGDGFAVLLQGDLRAPHVIAMVQEALTELAEPIYVGSEGIGVSASAGIVVHAQADTPEEFLRAAEIALHRAKEAGKAQWMLYDPELDQRDRSRYRLGAVIAGALEHGEFRLSYQPTVQLGEPGALMAVNAGLQWQHPERGELDSAEFYPLAAVTGMTIPLGRWLLSESLAATARWRERFGDAAPDVCVRLPHRLAIDPDLVLVVKEELDRHGLPGNVLRLCTDGISVNDPHGEVLDSLAVLADLGATMVLAVTGTADLELITRHQLPVRHIILSGPVVDALAGPQNETAEHDLRHLIERARALGLRIGAEGVRTRAHADRLRDLGVRAGRGPFVGESVTGEDVDQLIERHTR